MLHEIFSFFPKFFIFSLIEFPSRKNASRIRDLRFFGQSESLYTANHGPLTEFQASFKLDLLNYGSSGEEVIWFMLSIGELYFVNKNYL